MKRARLTGLVSRRRCTPSSRDSATMLSQVLSRSTAIRRNSFGYHPTRLFATCSPFLLVCLNECLSLGVHSTS